ncbi:MAG TPA: glutathione S-transferase [Beijerinckiaceae bacterium]|jgi:glutathione S-transferase|nr:glutathione S-transferase [Beijerinckiaceae bacterium]
MITVHHLENSRSQRVLWLLEELGLPFEVKHYARDKKTMMAPPELRAVHPLGRSPVITDDGKTIAESGAIVEYLVDTYGGERLKPPAGSDERLRYTYWLHFAEGTAMPPLLIKLIVDRMESAKAPFFIKPVIRGIVGRVRKGFLDRQIASNLDFMESELGKSEWFAGNEFTAADIQMSFPLEAASMRAGLDRSRPKLWDFLQRIHARPAYKRALEKGGKYELVK